VSTPTPFEDSIALRLLPGDCTLALVGVFTGEATEGQESRALPRLFVTHAEEGGAVAYAVVPLIPASIERREDIGEVVAHYELPFRPARAGQHALLLEVADGGLIEEHDCAIRVRHAYNA
jgi:hypothetical protein